MHRLISLVRRFKSDERGAFLAMFGIIAVVLVAMSGAVVDYTSVEQARTRAQVALDAAALGLQPQIYTKSVEDLRKAAEALLLDQLGTGWTVCTSATVGVPPCGIVASAAVDTINGVITLNAQIMVPMNFVALVGVNKLSAALVAEASRKKLNLEVALVLDNSNSMENSSRMTNLIAATKCAANILYNGDCASTATTSTNANVSMAIVPFTMLVNVGTGNASALWMDRKGNGSTNITNNNFDLDDNTNTAFTGPVDRIALFNSMKNISWGGCVEARRTPYDTNDAPAVSTDSDTMFTPLFAPDEPDSGFSNSYIPDTPLLTCPTAPTCTQTETKTNCSSYSSCSGTTTNTYIKMPGGTSQSSTSCLIGPGWATASDNTSYSGSGSNRTYTRTIVYNNPRVLQERLCKYTGATPIGVSQSGAHGPNSDCPVNAIQPLTPTKSLITTAINALDPQGGTNIHAGTEWGFRVLSPTEPFAQGKPYDQTTSKVMIIMTDGENTAYQTNNMNNTTFYSQYGFPYNNRMGTVTSTDAELEAEMNRRTGLACTNAKLAGIKIYTVGLSVDLTTNPAANITMLQNCSSGIGYYYFPTSSSQLTAVFTKIAQELAALRLVK